MGGLDLEGRVIVIAGAGRGIGRAAAKLIAVQGAQVVISSRNFVELSEVKNAIETAGGKATVVVADAVDEQTAGLPAMEAINKFGRLDGWVNAVGGHIGDDRHPLECPASLFIDHLKLNLVSAFLGAQEAAKAMFKSGGSGSIVNIGSGDSNHSGARVGYTAAKHGLVGLTRSLAMHWGPRGIRVNCVCPGWTNTELNNWDSLGVAWGMSSEQAYQRATDQNLQNRILEPSEVAEMIAFLVSDKGSGLTGQVINVDGGYRV